MNLPRAIALCRTQRGLTQADLASKASISVSYLSLLETGKRKDPTISTIQKLAEALGIPVGILFYLAADEAELSGLESDLQARLAKAALAFLSDLHEPKTLI